MPRLPLVPDQLRLRPFRREEALAAGLAAEQLRSSCWRRLLRGVYVWRGLEVTHEVRVRALHLALPPGGVVTGLTAAWLYGVYVPRPDQPLPLHLATGLEQTAVRRPEARSRRLLFADEDVVEVDGLNVTSPPRTCFELIRRGPLVEAVVVADAFLHLGYFSQPELWDYVCSHSGWRGVAQAREVVLLAHPDAESPMESRLRMVIVLGGLMEPCVNVPLHDRHGHFLGRPDLLYLDPLLAIEYDGAYHGEDAAHVHDLRRENRFVVEGVPVLRYSAPDVYRASHRILAEVGSRLAA